MDDIVELHMRRLDVLRSKALNMVDWEVYRETQPMETNLSSLLATCNLFAFVLCFVVVF